MNNVIHVSFVGNNESYSKTAASGNSSACTVKSNYLGRRAGFHSVDYYVNGILEHQYTAGWPFDFTGDWW